MPRFFDSIKHAEWPNDVVCMFTSFFDEVQRHYESCAKPIGGLYTISQAVYELRNQFHAHVRHHKEALILSLDPSELDRIREQLRAQQDNSTLLFDSYRSAQRDVSSLPFHFFFLYFIIRASLLLCFIQSFSSLFLTCSLPAPLLPARPHPHSCLVTHCLYSLPAHSHTLTLFLAIPAYNCPHLLIPLFLYLLPAPDLISLILLLPKTHPP